MAGPSSEVGSLNIGTDETSSHPEIEPEIEAIKVAGTSSHREIKPEIEAVEATGDSDEDCGLEKKECDGIMEHLKKNPGLVVKSSGPEGQIVLHVAVMDGKIEKPKPPASEDTVQGLREAAHDSPWYDALNKEDCKVLMDLLEANPCLVAHTGPDGWTVLHAAANRGCVQLLDQVLQLFKDKHKFVDEMSGVKVDLPELLKAKCGEFQAKAEDMAWFTCPREVLKYMMNLDFFLKFSVSELAFPSTPQSSTNASQELRNTLIEIMDREKTESNHANLHFESSLDYNFVLDRKELLFHRTCEQLGWNGEYVRAVIRGCLDLGPPESRKVLTHLLKLHNAQGQTPFHVAASIRRIPAFLKLLRREDADYYEECLNAKDVRGWTVLHYAVATRDYEGLKALLEDERINVNARTTPNFEALVDEDRMEMSVLAPLLECPINQRFESGMMALHLAILHNDVTSVELLRKCPRTDVNVTFCKGIMTGYGRMKFGIHYELNNDEEIWTWSPLQLAAIMGLTDIVRILLTDYGDELKLCDVYDDGKFYNEKKMDESFQRVSAILLASASGNPSTLRLFLDNRKFDPLVKFKGATALHYAVYAMMPMTNKHMIYTSKVGRFLLLSDLGHLYARFEEEVEDTTLTSESYLGRQACITMLLQAGIDIWEEDDQKRFAEPGPQASKEVLLWWHNKMAQETLEAKKSLNDAANAISVVAALVATASFVGPLQPPLGYGGDSMEGGIQDTHLSIRIFIVSNILSFYLAVASIIFAVVPSLPMPQEGIYAEWQRTRRTISVAIFFLLMSVLGVLISFGAASNSVVSEDYSWQHDGLSFYPTLLGGFICILSISLLFFKLLRLVFHRNERIRHWYKIIPKL